MIIGPIEITDFTAFFIGLVFLSVAGFLANRAAKGKKDWETALKPVGPDLKINLSPLDGTIKGLIGLAQYLICLFFSVAFFYLWFEHWFLSAPVFHWLVEVLRTRVLV